MAKEEEEQPKGKPSLGSFLHNPKYRAERKLRLLEYLYNYSVEKEKEEGNDGSLRKDRVIGLFSLTWGISGRVVRAYIDELESIGAILQRGDRIKAGKSAKMLLTDIPQSATFEVGA